MKKQRTLFALMIMAFFFCHLMAQSQSVLLPFSGDTYPLATGSKTVNFSNSQHPTVSSLPKFFFSVTVNQIYYPQGDPHNDAHLQATNSATYPDPPYYLFNEYYLGQHPAFAQSLVHDPYGNLLFFIVDNNIYNRHGVAFPKKTFPEDAPGPGYAYLHDGAPDHS